MHLNQYKKIFAYPCRGIGDLQLRCRRPVVRRIQMVVAIVHVHVYIGLLLFQDLLLFEGVDRNRLHLYGRGSLYSSEILADILANRVEELKNELLAIITIIFNVRESSTVRPALLACLQ